MTIRLNNYAHASDTARGGRKYFDWKIFVDEPPEVLKTIREVEYELHPTFPVRNHRRSNSTDGFALHSSGWGGFTVKAIVRFKDGRVEVVDYFLDLSRDWPGWRGL